MVNAILVGMEINESLPKGETPRDTEGYEGFYHLHKMTGDVAHTELDYIVRDHNKESFEKRQEILKKIAEDMNTKWGEGTVKLTIEQEYRNMLEIIEKDMHLIDNAKEACRRAGIEPLVKPIRGGTDGAQLSFKGLPCPNLGTGGSAFHGPFEHITAEGMDIATDIALEIVKIYAE